ncbi:MAG: cyanophycinase [Cytophagales bacterium]|nr:cyanophycinase [Cytophagales bacterium]
MKKYVLYILIIFIVLEIKAQGKLFIIGGGKRPIQLLDRLLQEANISPDKGYIMILPYSSEEQDSSIYYAKKQFVNLGIYKSTGYVATTVSQLNDLQIDSIANADLIYVPGGDQVKFMQIVGGNAIEKAIKSAYSKGKTIAGTSAGAAIMSQKMITGVEIKHSETSEDAEKSGFQTIEAENIQIAKGLGFLQKSIIDQHFIKRKRQNRLIAVAIENPDYMCIGVDEATAILVNGNIATVVGDSQVLVLQSKDKKYINQNGKLSAKNLKLDLYISGQSFNIKP